MARNDKGVNDTEETACATRARKNEKVGNTSSRSHRQMHNSTLRLAVLAGRASHLSNTPRAYKRSASYTSGGVEELGHCVLQYNKYFSALLVPLLWQLHERIERILTWESRLAV